MKTLIVLAHPNAKSFNSAVVDKIEETLKNKGEEVVVRELYKMKFEPVLTWQEMDEQRSGTIKEDILAEQKLIDECEHLIFVYPLWWTSLPAILKGYIDRVFAYGYAYAFSEDGNVQGLLKGKKATLITTYGTPKEIYDTSGMNDAIRKTVDTGIFEFCGMEVKEHIFLGGVPMIDENKGKEILESIAQKL